MTKRTLLTVGLSAMLAMPMLAVGEQSATSSTSSRMGSGGSSAGSRMEQSGQQAMSQEQIRKAQKHLKQAGFYQGSIDGQIGQQTQEALREYQKARGLPQTGRFDEPTKQLLMTQETQQQSPRRMESPSGSTPGGSTSGGMGSGGTGSGSSTGGAGMGSSGTGSTGSGGSGMGGSSSGGTGSGGSGSGR
jgi:peptidoglycan hydrolase-like protein with peptidoglycan-binding domain